MSTSERSMPEDRRRVRASHSSYVALAEALDATLLTLAERLGRVRGLDCRIEVIRD